MNRLLIVFILCIASLAYGYSWIGYGNSDDAVYDFLASPWAEYEILLSNSGVVLYEDGEWTLYAVNNLPAVAAAFLDSSTILVAMGIGSDDDGIHSFDITDHTFEIVRTCPLPRCISRVHILPSFICGYSYGSYISFNGLDWSRIDSFTGVTVHSCGISDSAVALGMESDIFVFDTSNRFQFGPCESWGLVEYDPIDEASGISASRRNEYVFWTHNDSGDPPRLFAMNSEAEHLGEYRVQGISNRDWEDIAIGYDTGTNSYKLYIGEIGDNNNVYATKYIYRVTEPEVSATQPSVNDTLWDAESIAFVYSDDVNHNAETLLYDPISDDLFVVTKGYGGGQEIVFRGESPLSTTGTMVFDSVATVTFPTGGIAVGGDISPSGTVILIKTYSNLYLWYRNADETVPEALTRSPISVPYSTEPQGEAVAWLANEMGYVTVSEEPDGNPAYLMGYERQCWYESAWDDGIVRDLQFISADSVFAVGDGGVWLSADRGRTWEQTIISPEMSSVALDSNGVIFVGWENTVRDSVGISVWWPSIEALVFINNGLRNEIIHALVPFAASMIACTDSGAARLDDYFDPMKLVCRRGVGDTVILSWDTIPAAMTYALYKGSNAYEIPLTIPFETVIVPDTSLVVDWIHGIPDTSVYFLGVALNEIETTSPSNRAGGFDFDLP